MREYNYILKVKASLKWKIDWNISDRTLNIGVLMNSHTLAKYVLQYN